MIDFSQAQVQEIYVHYAGNKLRDEGLQISEKEIAFEQDETKRYLLKYFLSSFSDEEAYNFSHSSDLELNEMYTYAERFFNGRKALYRTSVDIAKHLYEQSIHPKINGGELCICYIENSIVGGVSCNAIGVFKSERKDVFLKFNPANKSFTIRHEKGINVDKLDKGCLIFNLDKNQGYKICIVDSNKSVDTQYWVKDFLGVNPASDAYHFTKEVLSITKEYVTKQLSEDFSVSKAEKIGLLNRSVDYFKTHENFDKGEFEKAVFQDTSLIKSFRQFDESYRNENELPIHDDFAISPNAVKRQTKVLKSVLRLDKNFDIYIHGAGDLIQQGVESDGRKYYKIYYENEL